MSKMAKKVDHLGVKANDSKYVGNSHFSLLLSKI